jgi:hypothetical protein
LSHPGRIIQQGRPWAGIKAMRAGPGYPGQATCRLGRHSSSAAGPGSLHPGWASIPVAPAGRKSSSGWAFPGRPCLGWADLAAHAPALLRFPARPVCGDPAGLPSSSAGPPGLRPAWAPSALPPSPGCAACRLGLFDRLGSLLAAIFHRAPVGPDQEDPAWPGFPSRPPYLDPGWAGLSTPAGPPFVYCSGWARPGFPGTGRIITLQGRDLTSPGYILRPASTPSSCASPRMPLGSDWHILHHRMLVLGRSLAQTNISHLS